MKKVKFLVNTAYKGPRKEGDVALVPDDFAERWSKNGIAEVICSDDENNEEKSSNEPEGNDNVSDGNQVDYESMNTKSLFALCKEKRIEVEAKQPKEYYIDKLTNN